MNNIQTFNHPQFGTIRTSGTPDSPEFCAMDLCRVLGYVNGRDAVQRHVDVEDVVKCDTPTNGGIQQLTYVNESGMYALVLGSKMSEAKRFKHWITSEVLPTLRRTGSYSIEQLSRKQLAMMVVQAEEEKERLALENEQQKQQLEDQRPKVAFADAIIGSQTNILIRDMAKLLKQNGYDTGEKRLFVWLRENHYLTLKNMPTQRSADMGIFFVDEGVHNEGDEMATHFITKVTPKGQQYFINKFIHN